MRLIGMVIALSPLGVAALLFTLTAQLGYEVLGQLARYVGVVVLALCLHQFVVYSVVVRTLGGMSPRFFFGAVAGGDRSPRSPPRPATRRCRPR
jgi:DAACS family dicarboxylate/amino acid:cation (Na+ or H+) symporter